MKTKQFTSKIAHGSEEITMKIELNVMKTIIARKCIQPRIKIYQVIGV